MLLQPLGQLLQKAKSTVICQKAVPFFVPAQRHVEDRALISPSEFPCHVANIRFPDLDGFLRDFTEIALALFQFRIETEGNFAD